MTEEVTTQSGAVETPKPETDSGPAWFIDETTPGQGARPEWLPPNFTRASDVAKSYRELEKKLGAFTGAPESYDLKSLEIDENDFLAKEIVSVAKELNMSQEGVNKFLGRIQSASETVSNLNIEEEVKKLGKDGERQLVEYKNWCKDFLKPEEKEIVQEWVKDAPSLQMFNKMMSRTHMSAVPTAESMAMANSFEGVKALRAELVKNIARYENDKAYRADYSQRLARAVARDPNS